MRPLRVVFDTNVFTKEKFPLIEQSSLLKLCKAGQIIPIYGHVFLEETLCAYGLAKIRENLIQQWLPFISATVDRFCDDFIGIWHKELVQGLGVKANIFMSPKLQNCLLSNISNIPLDGTWEGWEATKRVRLEEKEKRAAQREVSKEIRQTIIDWRIKVNYSFKKHGTTKFIELHERGIDDLGKVFISRLIKCKDPNAVANRWTRNKKQYPYFTRFILNILYISYHASAKPNAAIDLNAQADLDLMTHLIHGDVLVSNETGFLLQAFSDLWKPQGKVIFNSEQFTNFINLY